MESRYFIWRGGEAFCTFTLIVDEIVKARYGAHTFSVTRKTGHLFIQLVRKNRLRLVGFRRLDSKLNSTF